MKKITLKRPLLDDEPSAFWVRLYLGAFFVVMALSQLFAFERFPSIIASYYIPVLSDFSILVAILVVFTEIAAIPALIGMKATPRTRQVGVIASWVALVYWLVVGLWQSVTSEFIANAGLFGAKVLLPQGWWLVCFILAHIVLYGFVSLCKPTKK